MWWSNEKRILIHIRKTPGSNLGQETGYSERSIFSWLSPVTASKREVSTSDYTTTSSFHILYNSLIAIPFDCVYFEVLAAPLSRPLINNQIDADWWIILRSVWGRCVVNLWAGGGWRRIGPVVRQCDYSNEILVFHMNALCPLQFPLWSTRLWLFGRTIRHQV